MPNPPNSTKELLWLPADLASFVPLQYMLDLIIAQGIFRLLIFEDLQHTIFGGEMCGDEVMKSEFSDLIGYDRR